MLQDYSEVHCRVRYLSEEEGSDQDLTCISSTEAEDQAADAEGVVNKHRAVANPQVDHRDEVVNEVACAYSHAKLLKLGV